MELIVYRNPRNPANAHMNMEVNARRAMSRKTKILFCQMAGHADHRIRINSKMYQIEIKAGCGVLIYNLTRNDNPESHIPAIYPKASYIIYSPEPYNEMDVLNETWVFTREQFLNFLTGYGKPMVKYNESNGKTRLNIQSFNSKRKQEYLWETLDNQPTLGEWLEEIRG